MAGQHVSSECVAPRQFFSGVLTLVAAGSLWVTPGDAAEPIVLAEDIHGGTALVQIELKAQGLFRPGLPPAGAAATAKMPKPLGLEIQTRLVFHERQLPPGQTHVARDGQPENSSIGPGSTGGPRKAVRHVLQAASAINGEVRPTAASIRPEVALLVAERRDRDGPVVVVSPAGPLTRSELELVQ